MTDIIEDHPIFEDYQPEPYKVYAQTDSENIITAIGSSGFIDDPTDWVQIDEGYDNEKHYHAQNNYLEKGLIDEQGCFNYKLDDAKPFGEMAVERTAEEKQAEIDARPAPPPTPQEQIAALTEDVEAVAEATAYDLEDTTAIAEAIAYGLEDATALGEALAGALVEIESLKARIAVLEGE